LSHATTCLEESALKLTAYTNYALRTLMFCALHPGQLVRMEDVSDAYGISRAHLLKAARQLGQLGYLKNVRGRSGGVRLGRAPEEIVIGEVVRQTEGDLELVECFNPETNTCPLIGACKLSILFRAGLGAFFAELDKVTLADMVTNGPLLIERLMANQATESRTGH
jgi:Rrf2 family transcriptional regulator, nitric oxide-sensitive transcriptional repressor